MSDRVEDYFNATENQKQGILDQHIDDFLKQRQEWKKRREKDEKNGVEREQDFRNRFQSQTKDERKNNSESRNPDDTARAMVYRTAMQQRMTERGVSMPRRGGRNRP